MVTFALPATITSYFLLLDFCLLLNAARRCPEIFAMAITEERIKALNDLGFEWHVLPTPQLEMHKSKIGASMPFKECIEELKEFKEKHGHTRVTMKQDKSLYQFCASMRSARRNPGVRRSITEDRKNALNDLEFDWDKQKLDFFVGGREYR